MTRLVQIHREIPIQKQDGEQDEEQDVEHDAHRNVITGDHQLEQTLHQSHRVQVPCQRQELAGDACSKGHLYRNCPDNPDRVSTKDSKILIAAGEDEIADEDVYDSTVFVIEDTDAAVSATATIDAVLFSATDVLLDNQAGRSIFKNGSLLRNLYTKREVHQAKAAREFRTN